MRPAAFRGVRFHTDNRGLKGGRRIKNHEFPKRNSNFPEDMGKKTEIYSVNAYLIGDDYMAVRDKLIAACDREGAGSYSDFWNLSKRLVVNDFRVTERQREGRYCVITIEFLEAGGSASPISRVATAAQLASSAASLATSAIANFEARYNR